MAKYERFDELPVWQQAALLYNAVLDLLEQPNLPLTASFRSQLDRAALSVSNNIAEGFERSTKDELLLYISYARGSAGEVRSMLMVVQSRTRLQPYAPAMQKISALAQSCVRQLMGWSKSIEELPFEGRRRLPSRERSKREIANKAQQFRQNFLKNLSPNHPLYNSREAREARGEK